MKLFDQLRRVDQRVFKALRQPNEDPEAYLRRLSAGPGIPLRDTGAVQQALQEHFAALDRERQAR